MNKRPLEWQAVIDRVACETTPVAGEPPFGFATRVVAAWRVAQREEGLRRWTRWSLRAALGSVAVCVLLVAMESRNEPQPVVLPTPSDKFITPSFLNQ
jgi:hypothetical protein